MSDPTIVTEPSNAVSAASMPARVLVCDDHEATRYTTSRLMSREGYRVLEAGTGQQCLELAIHEQPDLVILDVNLPDMIGYDVCRKLKLNADTSWIPVMHLSASFTEPEHRARGLDGGADAYLTDAAAPEVLLATVRALLRASMAERTMRKMALEWQQTFDSITDAILVTDLRGRVLRCNRAACALLGKPSAEIILQHLDVLLQSTLGEMRAIFFEEDEPERGIAPREVKEVRFGHRWMRISADTLPSSSGDSGGAVFIISDVTRRKELEEQLRQRTQQLAESEAFYRFIGEKVTFGVWRTDARGRNTYFSSNFPDTVGMTEDELHEFGWIKAIHPEDVDPLVTKWNEHVKTGAEWEHEFRIVDRNGKVRTLLGIGRPIHGEEGKIRGWAGVNIDITNVKELERQLEIKTTALASSEAFYRGVSESIPYGVWQTGPDGGPQYLSQSFLDLIGMSMDEVRQSGWTNSLPPEDVDAMLDKWSRCVRGNLDWDYEHRIIGRDGRMYYVLSRGKPVLSEEGRLTGYVGINLDITALKEAEQRLHEIIEELDAFTHSVSHDLRGPLANVSLYADILMRDCNQQLTEEGKRHLASILASTENMKELIERLLQLARVSGQQLEMRQVDTAEVVQQVLHENEAEIERRGVKVEVGQLPCVHGDPLLLKQVFANLLSNSLKYTRPRGADARIEIGYDAEAADPSFYVRDNGIGFRRESAHKLFQVFQRLHRPDEFEGSGVGLSIAQRIMARHGGRIWASSQENVGAEFRFSFRGAAQLP